MYAIETKDLTKRFEEQKGFFEYLKNPFKKKFVTAVDSVSIRVKYGELYGLLGANGAGKTTLLKMLSTLIIPDSGEAFIEGVDVVREPERAKYPLGLAYGDERSFFWRLTGRQNLEFYATLYDMSQEWIDTDVEHLLDLVGLKEKADSRVEDYSTGMKHRLAIARGLIGDRKILLMDEPTIGVDPVGKELIQSIISDIVKKEGKTVVLVTHDLNEAQKLCDRVAIMNKGKIVSEISDIKKRDLSRLFKSVVKE